MQKCISGLFALILMLCTTSMVYAQNITVSGTVTDDRNETLIGVAVQVKGTSIGVITDIDGKYSLAVPGNQSVLVFSYVGYASQEITVGSQRTFNVIMRDNVQALDEVVVIGYGTRQRRSVSGAIDQVGSQTFEERPVGNTMQALQGATANLTIQQRSANPTDNSMNINIRGITSMNNADPLLVVDGMISTGLDALTRNLNPNDIESVTVLKDASAAIYGSRSANGVILITTKQGARNATPRIRFSGGVGVQAAEILFRPVSGGKNAELRNHAADNLGQTHPFSAERIADLYAHQSEENWLMDQLYKNAQQQSYNLSVSGGSNNTTFLISGGYYKQESNFVGQDFGRQRFNYRTNLNTEWGKFKLTSTMTYTRVMDYSPYSGVGGINDIFRAPKYYDMKFKADDKYIGNELNPNSNQLALLEQGGFSKADNDNIIANINVEYNILPGLKARALAGIDLTADHRFRRQIQIPLYHYTDPSLFNRYLNTDRYTDDLNSKYYTLNTQFLLDYNRTFSSVHNVNAMLGASNESFTRERNSVEWRYTDPDLGLNSSPDATQAGRASNNYTTNQSSVRRSITSVFGRVGYNYDDRYYLDFTFRYDGSSRFHKDNRWGFFPSVAAAYRITEEKSMSSYKQNVGNLKLRASYGILGIQSVGDYAYFTTYSQQANRYGFNNVSVPGYNFSIGNESMTWENSAKFNVGFDHSFFRNSLDFTFDFFHTRTYDMLIVPVVPSVFGTPNAGTVNLGEMTNIGWEVTLAYRLKTRELSHRFSLNLADAKNKVTDFGGREQIRQSEEQLALIREGEALNSYYGYKSAGIFQSRQEIDNSPLHVGTIASELQPGDRKFIDQNGDGVIDEKDRVVLGNAFPRYTFGFTYDVAWKGFDLNIRIQGVGKREQMMRGEVVEPFHHDYWVNTLYTHQLDFWTPENPSNKYPRLATTGASRANNWTRIGNDAWLHDMAYLRVKEIRLGYTLPKQISAKAGIGRARISVNVSNPFTLSKQSWIDPEGTNLDSTLGGRDGATAYMMRNNYAFLRYYGINLDLEF